MEKELRAYRQAYRLVLRRASLRTVEHDGEAEDGEAGKRKQGRRAERRPAVGLGQLRHELRKKLVSHGSMTPSRIAGECPAGAMSSASTPTT